MATPWAEVNMIIVNADDWGRSVAETDAALTCHAQHRITSVTAMVFMRDSERAAHLALTRGLDVGLHLNYSQPFEALSNSKPQAPALADAQRRVCAFINANKYAFMLYNPVLSHDFAASYEAQVHEFVRLYGKPPSHVDGHHHKHLCANVLLGNVIPAGQKLRRNFFFWPGEKGRLNRAYRRVTNQLLSRKYRVTDYFFALSQCLQPERLAKVLALAEGHTVEVMTHPANRIERECLMSERYLQQLNQLERGSYCGV
jgi:chitin disaccharide deacetylase